MKIMITLAMLTLLAVPAYARLTPNDGIPAIAASAAATNSTALTAALNEQDYFRAPPQDAAGRAYRCTIRAIVFEKIGLAQACY